MTESSGGWPGQRAGEQCALQCESAVRMAHARRGVRRAVTPERKMPSCGNVYRCLGFHKNGVLYCLYASTLRATPPRYYEI
jgi:hypothetical protein